MDINNELIVTILIQMHGTVFTYELTPEVAANMNNVRLLCKAEGFNPYISSLPQEFYLLDSITNKFRKNINISTYNILSEATSGHLIGNITFDKELSTTGEPGLLDSITHGVQGIYLISIHNNGTLVYPSDQNVKLNLLDTNDLRLIAERFNRHLPNIEELSTPFPNQQIYIDEEERILETDEDPFIQAERIKSVKIQFLNALNSWSLTLKDNKIENIKLSVLVELIKAIIDNNCIINLLDYSCNSATRYIPDDKTYSAKYYVKDDIEQGNTTRQLGGIKKKYSRKINKKNKSKRKKRKSKKRYS